MKPKTKICGNKGCQKKFNTNYPFQKYCSPQCVPTMPRHKPLKVRTGFKKKRYHWSPSITSRIHNEATKKYKLKMLAKNGKMECEVCGSTIKFGMSVHHIMSAAQNPKHQNLHNEKNLILLCAECHAKIHAGESKELVKKLIEERGLKELFN